MSQAGEVSAPLRSGGDAEELQPDGATVSCVDDEHQRSTVAMETIQQQERTSQHQEDEPQLPKHEETLQTRPSDVGNRNKFESSYNIDRSTRRKRSRNETVPTQEISSIRQMQSHLRTASEELLDKLSTHLQQHQNRGNRHRNVNERVVGLTLPASAVGWISSQLFPDEDETRSGVKRIVVHPRSIRSRLRLLRALLPRLTHVRIVWSEEWPPPVNVKAGMDEYDIAPRTDRRGAPNRVTSRITSSDEVEEGFCNEFLDEYWRWKNSPRIDLRLFPMCQVLLLDQIPGRMIYHWEAVQESLLVLRVERTCIYNYVRRKIRQSRDAASTSLSNVDWTLFHAYFAESPEVDRRLLIPRNETKDMNTTNDDVISNQFNLPSLYEDYVSDRNSQTGDPLAPESLSSSQVAGGKTVSFGELNVENCRNPRDKNRDLRFESLTHAKFSHCCIGEPMATSVRRESFVRSISTPRLKLLCLSHNQVVTERTALRGLSLLPFLSKLDLSHNNLFALPKAHYRLGNLQCLILSHNHITTTAGGIDRLVSLEELALDYNEIPDLASVAGLARLPELKRITLKGNPLQRNIWRTRRRRTREERSRASPQEWNREDDNNRNQIQINPLFRLIRNRRKKKAKLFQTTSALKAYRVDVLNLFRERRITDLLPSATYRDLRQALPVLDDQVATLEELIALRERTFVPVNGMAESSSASMSLEQTLLVPLVHNEEHSDEQALLPPLSTTMNIKQKHGRQASKRKSARKVAIIDPRGNGYMATSLGVSSLSRLDTAKAFQDHTSFAFSMVDVLSSLSENDSVIRNIDESQGDILVDPLEEFDHDKDVFGNDEGNLAVNYLEAAGKLQGVQFKRSSSSNTTKGKLGSIPLLPQNTSTFFMAEPQQHVKPASAIPAGSTDATIKSPNAEARNSSVNISLDEDLRNLSLSAIHHESLDTSLRIEAVGTRDSEQSPMGSKGHMDNKLSRADVSVSSSLPSNADGPKKEAFTPPIDQIAYVNTNPVDGSSVVTDNQSVSRLALHFPSQAWHLDDQSIQSSSSWNIPERVDAPRNTTTINATKMFLWAEDNAVFEGPRTYKDLRILENLELYFRLFVFPKGPSASSALLSQSHSNGEGADLVKSFQTYQQQYPRIQLWPVDRRTREDNGSSSNDVLESECVPSLRRLDLSIGEDFLRVWKERVVACGKPAIERLTPNRVPRYSFHGELVWSTVETSSLRPEAVIEHRDVIICLSNRAFYIIQDHDKVVKESVPNQDRTTGHKKRKRFPLPIPRDARFADAKWPHAVVRHPFEALKGITIGFGFQRLTLHFAPSVVTARTVNRTLTKFETGDFTYILMTSNKVQTVRILNEIQKLATDAHDAVFGGPASLLNSSSAIAIENDDRHVLDAVGVAVAPHVIDVVLHYQILQQKWRRGDRGAVRRVCVITDSKIFLLDEDYARDGSDLASIPGVGKVVKFDISSLQSPSRLGTMSGETTYRLVDSASLQQITEVQAADADPNAITLVIKPESKFQKSRNWRLLCRDGQGAERLVDDVRKALAMSVE